ncbi:MAG: TlpA family protein disulfide reductase [Phycisphaerales bacterium]|nr:MAG: TlpA family protein disulfide reductase [Phycisphaerales bacterium]
MHHDPAPRRQADRVIAAFVVSCICVAAALALASPPAHAMADRQADPAWIDRGVPRVDRSALETRLGRPFFDIPAAARWHGAEPIPAQNLRGKVVVIQTWSRTNRLSDRVLSDLADLVSVYNEKDTRLAVLAVHAQAGAQGVPAYLSRRETPFPILIDESGEIFHQLGVGTRPVNIVLDKAGVVRHVGLSQEGLAAAIEELMLEPYEPPASPAPANTGASRPVPSTGAFPAHEGEVRGALDLRGKPAPPLEVGQWLSPAPRTAGKVVVVDFWATWCGPCIQMIPHMNNLARDFSDDVVVVGLSNEDAGTVRNFMRQREMRYPVAIDRQARMQRAVEVRSIPQVMVVSPDGVVRWQGHPGRLTNDVMRQIVEASRGQG